MMRNAKKELPILPPAKERPMGFKIPKKKPNNGAGDVQAIASLPKEANPDLKNVTERKFKIPKKNADDWNEDIQMISPLSRVANPDIRTVTYRKHGYASSYAKYNVARNTECREYYKTPRNNNLNREPSINLVDIERSESERQSTKDNFVDSNSSDDAPFISSSKSPSSQDVLKGPPESLGVSRIKNNMDIHSRHDADAKYPKKRCSVEIKEQTQETPSRKVCQHVVPPNNDFDSEPGNRSGLAHGMPIPGTAVEQNKVGSGNKHEQTHRSKRAGDREKKKPSSPPNAHAEHASARSLLLSSDPISDMSVDSKDSKISSDCSDLPADNVLPSSHMMNKRKRAKQEPIIESSLLSSEEKKIKPRKTETCTQAIMETSIEIKNNMQENPSLSIKEVPMDCCDAVIVSTKLEEVSVLQLKLLNVYFGKMKAASTGSVTFTMTSIEIPLKVSLDKSTCLTLDTGKLKKYALWFRKTRSFNRSTAVIMLWIAADFVSYYAKQMDLPPISQASKSNELIFLELVKPPSGNEQLLLSDIMKEASKNASPALADKLSWKEMYDILDALSPNECSFKEYINNQPSMQPSSATPPAKAPELKPCYIMRQNSEENVFTCSLTQAKDTCLPIEAYEPLARLVVYPPPPTKGGLAITEDDIDCLEDGAFLNDVIIDFYLKYLMLEKFPQDFAKKCHVFSSFFYWSLTRKDSVTNQQPSAYERHQRVRTWTRHVDIFSKDFIFVPVNEHSHWYLAVICFPGMQEILYEEKTSQDGVQHNKTYTDSVIVFNDIISKKEESGNFESEGSSSSQENTKPKQNSGKCCKRPCILIFDSLKSGSVFTTVKVLKEYLKVEWELKKHTPQKFSDTMVDIFPNVPKQRNGTDCGLYLLKYADSFFEKPIENFDTPMHLENWFADCEVRNKRHEIRDLLLQLHIEQKQNGVQLPF